ncbi:DUF802 domain-containing protein [Actimicrobium antarcticum]|uniref:DUF802 domain-containing protein n=1 Tax=Actimicrobium antarcticum TaxID=1051899 RepID=A0ABP7SS42_9BURK
MNRHAFTVAFFLGAIGIIWIGIGFIDSSFLALAMTTIIGAVYAFGALELRRFRQATATLAAALAAIPANLADLGDWLAGVPASLQNSVRLRIEGERVGLPGPALTPYLVGLLVMLGMLGTFLGMVVTLKGAVFALENTTDLQAMRSALAVPVKGLGLAFGTSVAGVAASAMLGLMSALSRRERVLAAQRLDTSIATVLRRFSLTHQRQETFKALQLQSLALPAVVDQLQAMMGQMNDMNQQLGQQLSQRLLGNQENFHSAIKGVYTDLASAVDQSLRDSLSQSAHVAGESIKPIVEAAMSGIAREATLMHGRMADTVQLQLDGLSARFTDTAATVADTWTASLTSHEQANSNLVAGIGQALAAFSTTFEQRSGALVATVGETYASLQTAQATRENQQQQAWTQSLEVVAAALTQELQHTGAQTLAQQQQLCDTLTRTVQDITAQAHSSASTSLDETSRLLASAEELMRSRIAAEADWVEQHRARMDQLTSLLRSELGALRDDEALRGNAAVERLAQLQTALTSHLTTLGSGLEAPITRLIETASEAPRAAAAVIGQLRQEISGNVARDNALLEERSRIMATLDTLLTAINHASVEQRAVIDALVASSAVALTAAGGAFSDTIASEAAKLSDIAAHVTSSAIDVSSLSASFGVAVQTFGDANDKLIANLQRIEGAMDKSMLRSDEQLAYYVAQARDIIDLSLMSQKEMVEELRQLPAQLSERAN